MLSKIKVLIIDDSRLIRELLSETLSADRRIEVVGCAEDPIQARQMIKDLRPDVLTLDVEMPKMDGITFLKNLMRLNPLPVVMISTLTSAGSETTFQALDLGAVDFIEKPSNLTFAITEYSDLIVRKVRTAARINKDKLIAHQRRLQANFAQQKAQAAASTTGGGKITMAKGRRADPSKILTIGGSTGGLEALRNLLTKVQYSGAEAIVVALHLPGTFTKSYAKRLDNALPIHVKEAENMESIKPGNVYIAPGGTQMRIQKQAVGYRCVVTDEPPVNLHKPSVEVLFDSVADQAGRFAVGMMLTGMGKDGAVGMLNMYQNGAKTYAQDEESSIVWGMPGAAVELNAVSEVMNLEQMAAKVSEYFAP